MGIIETMSLVADIATAIGVFGVLAGIFYAAQTFKQQKEISQADFFAEYTKRYQDIILHFPENWDAETILNEEVKRYLRLYFDLCSEEYFLYTEGKCLNKKFWNECEQGMKIIFNKTIVKNYWQERKNLKYNFDKYVNENILTKN